MSRGLRLPTLYPMPRDRNQYWQLYQAALSGPAEDEYLARVSAMLQREDGQPYSAPMLSKLVSNITGKGFLYKAEGKILPPETVTYHRWDGTWDGSESGFATYIHYTLLKWGRSFPDGNALAYDLLSELDSGGPRSGAELWRAISDPETGTYDGREPYGPRTVQETLRILEYAGWVARETGPSQITAVGRRRRSDLRDRDVYHQIERLFSRVDPVHTKIFSVAQKIELSKVVMYRESGGKGRTAPIQDAYDVLFKPQYTGVFQDHIKQYERDGRARLKQLKDAISRLSAATGRRVEKIRNEEKLQKVLEALENGREDQASLILDSTGAGLSRQALDKLRHAGASYTVAPGLAPHKWQSQALDKWTSEGNKGVLKVVTGAGKTIFALFAIQDLRAEHHDLRVTVLVPTKVLMYQWATELVRTLGVPADDIGLRGDGHKDSFQDGKRVVVSIINSAVLGNHLKNDVGALPRDTRHFLIADEVHRYRGREFRKAFEARYDYSLGLSATPVAAGASGDPGDDASEDPVTDCLGPVIYEYSYREALADQVVQPFHVSYLGVQLTSEEQQHYDRWTKRIKKALRKIRQRYGPRLEAMGGSFYARLHSILNSDERADPAINKYFEAVRKRKALIYGARNRKWAYLDVMTRHTAAPSGHEDRIIVFHERIANLEEVVAPIDRRGAADPTESILNRQLQSLLFNPKLRAVMYHSKRSSQVWNEVSMEFFREGIANVMLSVKALVEGVDVPAANVGVIRASSSSVRQRIQTTGRILRRSAGKARPANLYVIYVRDTSDERIFRDVDWSEELGSGSINSYHWFPPDDPESASGQWVDQHGELPVVTSSDFRHPVLEFDVEALSAGDPYPGRYAGAEYHVDAAGRPFRNSRRGREPMLNAEAQQAASLVMKLKRGGKFVITPEGHMITRVEGELVFLGLLTDEPRFEPSKEARIQNDDGRPPSFEELFGQG